MKVRQQDIDEFPSMPWHNERSGKPGETGRVVVSPAFPERFKGPRHRCPDCDDATSSTTACRNCLCRGNRHFAPLLVNMVIGDPLCSHWAKRIQSDVERNLSPAKAALTEVSY